MRRLFVDLDSGLITIAAGTTQPLTAIEEKRGPNSTIEVQFLRNVTPVELSSGASGRFEVKETGKYDSNPVTAALSWTPTGTGVNRIYTFTLPLSNPAIDALLGVNPLVNFSVNTGTDVITTASDHELAVGNIVQLTTTNTLPAPFEINTDYFVVAPVGADTLKLALTAGGAAIDITTTGTGTQKIVRVDNDEDEITLMAALQWIADGRTNESQTLIFKILNDVVRDDDTAVPPEAAYIILGVRAGKEPITNGAETVAVVFDTPFDGGSDVCVTATVAMPSGGDNLFATIQTPTLSVAGFTAKLNAAAPATGYILHWKAVAI